MFWKRFFIVIGLLVILAFVAQLLAAPYVKGLIIKGLKESLGVDATIGDCAVSVLQRKVILDDVTVLNPEKKDDYILKAKEISVDFYLLPSLFNKYILNNIVLTNPEAILYLDESGKLKVPQFKKKDGAKKGGELLFKRFAVENGNFKFIDQKVSKPATITGFSSINCEIVNSVSLSGRTIITGVNAKGNIEGQGKFSVDGKGKFIEKPMSFDGNIKIENLPITKFSVYWGGLLPVKVNKGNLFLDTKAACDKGNLDVKNRVSIKDLALEPIGDPNQTVLFELKTEDVITFLKDENNTVNFSFDISGDLAKPDFKWGAEMGKALRNAMLKAFTDGVGRLFISTIKDAVENPAKAGEKIGNMIGGDTGETVKKIGDKINKQLDKIMGK
ncbi:MAG: DUF748 domain-containing protein [Candidatus Omnitrophica bacterium]|nr:DUF748 domain-containing protein [Candidatus Omnitrophota bacterium]